VSELCGLRVSAMRTVRGRRVLEVRVKGGRDRLLPLPEDVWKAVEAYLTHPGEPKTRASPGTASEPTRRKLAHSGGERAWLFQPSVNYRTRVHDKPLTSRQVHAIVSRYAALAGIKGKVSPHDLRRTFVTLALDQGLTPRQIVAATGHKDERIISRYDKGRENLDINAINFLSLDDLPGAKRMWPRYARGQASGPGQGGALVASGTKVPGFVTELAPVARSSFATTSSQTSTRAS